MLSLRQSPSGAQLIVVDAHFQASPTVHTVNLLTCTKEAALAPAPGLTGGEVGNSLTLFAVVLWDEAFHHVTRVAGLRQLSFRAGLKLPVFWHTFSSSSSTLASGLLYCQQTG